jgi:hypothetical protein
MHRNVPFPESLEKKAIEEKELEGRRESSQLGKGSRRWIAIVIVVIVLIGVAATAAQMSQNATRPTSTTNTSISNTVWNDKQFVLNGTLSWIQATLNPLQKTSYVANGHVEVIGGCLTIGGQIAKCPTITLWVVNQSELQVLLSNPTPPRRTYANAVIPDEENFTLTNLDHNGQYFFAFENQEPSFGPNPIVSISLTETWTETRTVTQIVSIPIAEKLDIALISRSYPDIDTKKCVPVKNRL